jgi:tetratricopeptide (TPR) repeat protein
MSKEDSSSWSEIKSLVERLAREPDSFCFARLSELYLTVGLVADALHSARQGVAKHPGYLAGQRALAMACNANGLGEESRSILEQVTAAMPEDTTAQKLLASLCVEAGDKASAIRAYTTLLEFRPDDAQSKAQLEGLQQADPGEPLQAVTPSYAVVYDEMIAEEADEDVYELSEDDIIHDGEEDETSDKEVEPVAAAAADVSSPVHHDPLSTLTLAELYEQQGFIPKALDIYRIILADDPDNAQLQTKISQLEQQESAAKDLPEQFETADKADEPEPFASAAFEGMLAPVETHDFSPLVHNQADNVVGTLDNWLENIRRIKACR